MKRHTFLVAANLLVLLVAAISFATLRNSSSTHAASLSTSRPQLRNVVNSRAPDSCPITKPPAHAFVPPSPYPTDWGQDSFWFGTTKLWTVLAADGTWNLRHYRPTDTSLPEQTLLVARRLRLASRSAACGAHHWSAPGLVRSAGRVVRTRQRQLDERRGSLLHRGWD